MLLCFSVLEAAQGQQSSLIYSMAWDAILKVLATPASGTHLLQGSG